MSFKKGQRRFGSIELICSLVFTQNNGGRPNPEMPSACGLWLSFDSSTLHKPFGKKEYVSQVSDIKYIVCARKLWATPESSVFLVSFSSANFQASLSPSSPGFCPACHSVHWLHLQLIGFNLIIGLIMPYGVSLSGNLHLDRDFNTPIILSLQLSFNDENFRQLLTCWGLLFLRFSIFLGYVFGRRHWYSPTGCQISKDVSICW